MKGRFNINMLDEAGDLDLPESKPNLISEISAMSDNKNREKFLIKDDSVPQIVNDLSLSDFEG